MRETEKKNVLVIFGGSSPEHEVSCVSAASLVSAIKRDEYEVICLGITKTGEWLLTLASPEEIAVPESWSKRVDNRRAFLLPDCQHKGLLIEDNGAWRFQRIDVAFPIIHGETGEDGKLPALLDLAKIPYVGSGVCASACGMDKTVTMLFADLCHIRRPKYYSCDSREFLEHPEDTAKKIYSFFESCLETVFPLFVKPASVGSSIGISKVSNMHELHRGLELAAEFGGNLIVEETITGRELKVAVMGDREITVADICEIVVEAGSINTYDMKYKSSGQHKKIPAELGPEKTEEIKQAAAKIYQKLGCRDYARVDFFLSNENEVYFNEINTVPGYSDHSIFSLMFESAGLPYAEQIKRMLEAAIRRG